MKINRVTITGIDSQTDIQRLLSLQEKYPFVEWGVLFSSSDIDRQRFPSEHQRKKFLGIGLNLSAHFCGSWSREVIENKNTTLIIKLPDDFKRVQLNYNFSRFPRHKTFDPGFLLEGAIGPIIFQWNKSNASTLSRDKFPAIIPENVHFLYDSSGGRGVLIKKIQPPKENQYTGYSGGIGPDTIDSVLFAIQSSFTTVEKPVWIDMESAVRTDNNLDLDLVEKVLAKVAKVIS